MVISSVSTTGKMFPMKLLTINIKNTIGVIQDVCKGTVLYAKNIHRCTPYQHNSRYPSRHPSGLHVTDVDRLIEYLKHPGVKNVIVLAGAGISTPCGIPDFRTPGAGIFDRLEQYNIPKPELIFDINYFRKDHRPFFSLAKEIYPGKFKPSVAHFFVRLLHEKEKLLRIYTQNIDGLERLAGIPSSKVVEAHGTFETATCIDCGAKYDGLLVKEAVFSDEVPICQEQNCKGIIKPDIVFYGEWLPSRFYMHFQDIEKIDLMIVMGTSLVVYPFSQVAYMMPREIPRLIINKTDVVAEYRGNDIFQQGDVQDIIPELVQKLGWSSDFQNLLK